MIRFLTSAVCESQWPHSTLEVLLVGRSNVGKSTFLNRYSRQKIAYVGKTPGKTRLLNFFCDEDFTLVDAPGYGYARRTVAEKEDYRRMMEEYFAKRSALKMVILLVDARHKPSVEDGEMIEFLRYHHYPVFIIATKVDKLRMNDHKKSVRLIADELGVPLESVWFRDLSREKEMEILRNEIAQRMHSFR